MAWGREREYTILFGGYPCTLRKRLRKRKIVNQYLELSPKLASFREYLAPKVAQI